MRLLPLLLLSILPFLGCHRAETRRVFFILVPSHDNPFFKAEADAAAALAERMGYRVRVEAHDDDAYRQDNLVDAAIAANASALILDNAGADSSVAAIRRATNAGIPVFLIDRAIGTEGIAKAQILADGLQGAQLVAKQFATVLHNSGEYAELLGRESDTNAQIRTQGFRSVLAPLSSLKRVAVQSANWSQAEAYSKTETILQAHSGIKGIIAGNDTMALGAVAALRSTGLHNIQVVGFDGIPDALQAIRNGELDATALQPAVVIAELAVREADTFLKLGSTGRPERQVVPCDLVTRQNADEYSNFEKIR